MERTRTAGPFMFLSDKERRCYAGLHALCQEDSPGTLATGKVWELLKASQLPADTLHQITDLCGARRLAYFGTGQFYVAIKLLAAAQSGLPIHLDNIKSELPLPRFYDMKDGSDVRHSSHSQTSDGQGHQFVTSTGPVQHGTVEQGAFKQRDGNGEVKETWSPPRSPIRTPPSSPSSYHNYTQSNLMTSVDTQLAMKTGQLKSQQENSSPGHYGTNPASEHGTPAHGVERIASNSTEDYPDDPWRITEEQRDYYTHQFLSLQPDLAARILGAVAKDFFTKSKLPIPELSHIWDLSDVDRDGALTLHEFCTAFHLIVARKNGYPLPEKLPPTLLPSFTEKDGDPSQTSNKDVLFCISAKRQQEEPPSIERSEPLILFEETERESMLQDRIEGVWLQSAATKELKEESSMSVFSPKRAAVFLEKAPDQQRVITEKQDPHQELDLNIKSRARPRSYSSTSIEDAIKKSETPPTPPPRPQKSHSRASSLDLNKLFQQSVHGGKSGWLPPPPALPPRPVVTQTPHFGPAVEHSQKAVQQPNFADFSRFTEEEDSPVKEEDHSPVSFAPAMTEAVASTLTEPMPNQPPQKPVRRKYRPESQVMDSAPSTCFLSAQSTPAACKTTQRLSSKQKKKIQTAIRKNKEANAVLTRLNSELQQQLKVVHQERVALETQLEILRPIAFV